MKVLLQIGMMLLVLVPCCIMDLKTKTLPVIWLWVYTLIGIAVSAFGKEEWTSIFLGFIPGFLLFFISFVTNGGIGRGDAYLYLAIGSIIGVRDTLIVLFLSLLLAAGYGVYLLKVQKKQRNYKIPFAPFTAGGYGIFLLIFFGTQLVGT